MLALGVSDNDDAPLILEGMEAEAERLEALFPLHAADRYLLRYGDPAPNPCISISSPCWKAIRNPPTPLFADFQPGMPRALLQAPAVQASGFPWLRQLVLTVGMALAIAD